MAQTAIEALQFLMSNTASVSSLCGTYAGTAFPLIIHGVIPQNQQALPAISFYGTTYKNKFRAASDQTFNINCYAASTTTSLQLAIAVYELFDDAVGDGDGYPIQTFSNVLQSIPEQSGEVVNTPVQVRVISRRP